MASPIGIIIIAVAVFEIHIDRNPVATINPRTIRSIFVPIAAMIVIAIRQYKFHFSIARAITNAPINKKIVSPPSEEAADLIPKLFVSGNSTSGSSDVARIGMSSVIHQIAIQIVLANTPLASMESPYGFRKSNVKVNRTGPRFLLFSQNTI